MDISHHRASCPLIICSVCQRKPDEIEDTALHFGLPPSRFGIIFIRVKCHGAQQDIACSFEWAKNHRNETIQAFSYIGDLGLIDLVYRDGFSLPDQAKGCQYQLEEGGASEQPWMYSHIDRRFINQMNRLVESMASAERSKWNKLVLSPKDMCSEVRSLSYQLDRAILRSEKEAVPTATITEWTAKLALILMKINQQIGTPAKPRTNEDGTIKWIDDVLPKVAVTDSMREVLGIKKEELTQ